MKKNKFIISSILILFSLVISSCSQTGTDDTEEKKVQTTELFSPDGPYLLYTPEGKTRMIYVDAQGKLVDSIYSSFAEDEALQVEDSKGQIHFEVKRHSIQRPEWKYEASEKVFVMSDPHGDLESVVSLLQGNGIINEQYQWSFGTNHLVVIGDIFDRGEEVTPIFWLFYKLEAEANQVGGKLSFLLGNHEVMVLRGDLRYAEPKYSALAKQLKMDYPSLWGANTELGRWLATRNTVEIIGENLYVHAGLSKSFYDENVTLSTVNETVSQAIFKSKVERKAVSPLTAFLYGSQGPLWYRRLVREDEKYDPISSQDLQLILDRYQVKHIVVGHTIFPDISTFYEGKVIGVNVKNALNRQEKRGRALLIEAGNYQVVGDDGFLRTLN